MDCVHAQMFPNDHQEVLENEMNNPSMFIYLIKKTIKKTQRFKLRIKEYNKIVFKC